MTEQRRPRVGDVYRHPTSTPDLAKRHTIYVVTSVSGCEVKCQPYFEAAWDSWYLPSDIGELVAEGVEVKP